MNKVESIRKLNAREIELGIAGTTASWHQQYVHSPVVYIGGLQSNITSLKLVQVFEQYGVVNHVHLKRDEKTGNVRGFAFLAYDDARSTVLAVDNLNGFNLDGRLLSVDHVQDYKYPVDALGASSQFNMRPEYRPVTENSMATTAETRNDADDDNIPEIQNKRKRTVLERLKEYQRRRAEDQRLSQRNSYKDGRILRKRLRGEVNLRGEREKRVVEDEVEDELEYGNNKSISRRKKNKEAPGSKEARRLERAAIREERRRRRAKRLGKSSEGESSS